MSSKHPTPRMGNRPHDPAFHLLQVNLGDPGTSAPRVYRKGCFICEDMEFARMGLPLCSPCCVCRLVNRDGHIAADDGTCDDCGHDECEDCGRIPAQQADICTCDTPCCEVDVEVGIITCGSSHCPTHGSRDE